MEKLHELANGRKVLVDTNFLTSCFNLRRENANYHSYTHALYEGSTGLSTITLGDIETSHREFRFGRNFFLGNESSVTYEVAGEISYSFNLSTGFSRRLVLQDMKTNRGKLPLESREVLSRFLSLLRDYSGFHDHVRESGILGKEERGKDYWKFLNLSIGVSRGILRDSLKRKWRPRDINGLEENLETDAKLVAAAFSLLPRRDVLVVSNDYDVGAIANRMARRLSSKASRDRYGLGNVPEGALVVVNPLKERVIEII